MTDYFLGEITFTILRSMYNLYSFGKIWLISGIMFVFELESKAQNFQTFTPDTLLSQVSVYQWSGENVLRSNNISSSLQASNGFIWITTHNGLMRFDGDRVDVYDRSTLPFLTTDSFYEGYESNSGTLYFASQASGIIRYDGSFSKLLPDNLILPNAISSLLVENDSSIYAGSTDNGLYHILNGVVTKISHKWLDNITIFKVAKSNKGELWIATDGNGLIKYFNGEFTRLTIDDGLFTNIITAIDLKNDNKVLIGTSEGLNIYENDKLSEFSAFENIQINAFYNDEINRTWVATEKGLGRLDWRKNTVEFIDETHSFPFTRLNWIDVDQEGNIWISTGRDGLLQIKKTAIVSYSESDGLSDTKTNVITQESENTFLIGTDVGKIDRWENGIISEFPINVDLNKAGIRDIYIDGSGTYWIASYQGLLKKTKSSEQLLTLKDGLPSIELRRIISDDNGYLWIASRTGGVFKLDGESVVAHYDATSGLGSSFVLALEKDSENNIYLGTHSGGVSIISPQGEVTNYPITENDLGIVVFNIHIEDPEMVWVVSNKEIYYFKDGTFKPFQLFQQPSGVTYYDWLEDNNGNAWITSNSGVFKIDKEELNKFKKENNYLARFELFDSQEGMKNKQGTSATHATQSIDGNLWIPTVDGVAIIYPDHVTRNEVIPEVHITNLVVEDSIFYQDTFEIEPGKLRYMINFTSLSFSAPSKVNFKYKLQGFDNEWISLNNERQVEYTNLSPNTYTFMVQSSNNHGVWNNKGDEITFKVKPYFWQTWMFYVLMAACVFMLFYLIYRLRVGAVEKSNKELRKVNSELDRFVYSASHDLKAPLASILGIVTLMRIDKENTIESYLKKIEISINKLDEFIKDIINFSRNARLGLNYTEIDFEKLINEAIEELKYQTDNREIVVDIKVKGENVFYTDRKRVCIILKNIISNAFKYADKNKDESYLNISVIVGLKKARVTIEDNGIGINNKYLGNIYDMFYRANENNVGSGIGLYIVKETIEKLGGTIRVTSEQGLGTKLVFELQNKK